MLLTCANTTLFLFLFLFLFLLFLSSSTVKSGTVDCAAAHLDPSKGDKEGCEARQCEGRSTWGSTGAKAVVCTEEDAELGCRDHPAKLVGCLTVRISVIRISVYQPVVSVPLANKCTLEKDNLHRPTDLVAET